MYECLMSTTAEIMNRNAASYAVQQFTSGRKFLSQHQIRKSLRTINNAKIQIHMMFIVGESKSNRKYKIEKCNSTN